MEGVNYNMDDAIILGLELWIMATITCSGCRKTEDVMNVDSHDAAEYFFTKGWRFGRDEDLFAVVHCAECVKNNKKL